MSKPHIVLVTLTPKPNEEHALAAFLSAAARSLPDVEGCRTARAMRRADGAGYLLFEEWSDADSHQRHLDTLSTTGALAELNALLAAPLEGKVLTDL